MYKECCRFDGNKNVNKIYPKKEEKLYELLTKGYQIIRNNSIYQRGCSVSCGSGVKWN